MSHIIIGSIAYIACFIAGSYATGGRRVFSTYRLWFSGFVADLVPTNRQPRRFRNWYNTTLMNWQPPANRGNR